MNVRLLDEQFEAIERNAFTGRLVPQYPADPPASALLARLRAEREAARGRPNQTKLPKLS